MCGENPLLCTSVVIVLMIASYAYGKWVGIKIIMNEMKKTLDKEDD